MKYTVFLVDGDLLGLHDPDTIIRFNELSREAAENLADLALEQGFQVVVETAMNGGDIYATEESGSEL